MLDGLGRVDAYVERAKKLGMTHMGLTDHGSLMGAPSWYRACKDNGLNSLLGIEHYFVESISRVKEEKIAGERFHVIMLARNEAGFRTLTDLTTEAHRNFYRKPIIDRAILEQLGKDAENLTVLSGCAGSIISKKALTNMAHASEEIEWWTSVFPNFYIELQNHFTDFDKKLNLRLVRLAKRHKLDWVVTGDSHFVHEHEADPHSALLAIQTASDIDDPNRFKFDGHGYHLKGYREMKRDYASYRAEVWDNGAANTMTIARDCNLVIPDWDNRSWHIPKFPKAKNSFARLKRQALRGLAEKGLAGKQEYVERMYHELAQFEKAKMADFLLITADIVQAVHGLGFRTGPGRGSAAGTLVGFLIGIHKVDSQKFDLLFERFLNPERPKMPDVDTDVPPAALVPIFAYAQETYGAENVMHLAAFGTLQTKRAFQTLGKAYGLPYQERLRLSALMTEDEEGNLLLPEEIREGYPDLVDTLDHLVGLKASIASHPAGVLIFSNDDPIRKLVPEMWVASSKKMVAQIDLKGAEALGLMKQDILGLRTLATVTETVRMVSERHGVDIEPDDWVPDEEQNDKAVYRMLARGKTAGVFQLEGKACSRGIKEIQCDSFASIVHCTSLWRAGPLIAGAPKRYLANKASGRAEALHSSLKPYLSRTWGEMCIAEGTKIHNPYTGERINIESKPKQVQSINSRYENAKNECRFISKGTQDVWQVTLASGAKITATQDHEFLTEFGWVHLQDLLVGKSYIAAPKSLEGPVGKDKHLQEKAKILGYLLGDGGLTRDSSIIFTSKDPELTQDFRRCVSETFTDCTFNSFMQLRMVERTSIVKKTRYGPWPSSMLVWLREVGLKYPWSNDHKGGPSSAEKFIPEQCFIWKSESIKKLLAALWDTDGHISNASISYKTISPQLAEDVRTLLLRLGMRSCSYVGHYKNGDLACKSYQVEVTDKDKFHLIQEHMVSWKRDVVTDKRSRSTTHTVDREAVLRAIKHAGLKVGKPLFRALNSSALRFNNANNRLSETLANNIANLTDDKELKKILNCSWDKVVSVTPAGQAKVYDLSVEVDHNFVANNIIAHNCFQEQYFAILNEIAGFSWARVDDAKTAMTRKDPVKMNLLKDEAIAGFTAIAGMSAEKALEVWETMAAQASYMFNEAHAVAYSILSYQTARLKYLYPLEYIVALLRTVEGKNDAERVKRDEYLSEACARGFKVLPPDIKRSDAHMTCAGAAALRFGLVDIKGVGDKAAAKIVPLAKTFKSLADVEKAANNKGVMAALAGAGALECFGVKTTPEVQEQLLQWQFHDVLANFREKLAKKMRKPKTDRAKCLVGGQIVKVERRKTKTKKDFVTWQVQWLPGESWGVTLWSEAADLWDLEKGSVVSVEGRWSAQWSNIGVGDSQQVNVLHAVRTAQ